MLKLKIKKGDQVIVITGKDKGKQGRILKVLPKENRAIVSGINLVKRHTKPSKVNDGGILSKELSIHISNLSHIDPTSGLPTKVSFKILPDNSKVRISRKSGEIISTEGK